MKILHQQILKIIPMKVQEKYPVLTLVLDSLMLEAQKLNRKIF